MKDKDRKGAAVVSIGTAAAAAYELPSGFVEAQGFGMKRCDGPLAPRLVRLGDLVHWLEGDQLRSRAEALAMVMDNLKPEHLPHLAELDRGQKRARPLADTDMFGFPASEELQAREEKERRDAANAAWKAAQRQSGVTSRWGEPSRPFKSRVYGPDEPNGKPAHSAAEPGLPALLERLKKDWVGKQSKRGAPDLLDHPWVKSAHLAVALPLAFELWGLGVPVHALAAPPVDEPGTKPADDLAGLGESLRQALLQAAAERKQDKEASDARGKSVNRVAYSSFQRVAMADAVDALNKLRPGTGRRVVAEVMDIKEKSLDDAIEPQKLKKARDDEREKAQALTGSFLVQPKSGSAGKTIRNKDL